MHPIQPETPLVWLGLAGFTVEQRAAIESAMVSWHAAGGLPWRLGSFPKADAWMIHGAKARLVSGQTLRVQPAALHERVIQIDLDDTVRPMAFARPVSAAYGDHPLTFDLAVPGQILAALAGLEAALADVRTDFALGGALIRQAQQLQRRVYAVRHPHRGELARVDLVQREVAVSPLLLPEHVPQMLWEPLDVGSPPVPAQWRRSTPTRLRWVHADRTQRDLLPPRYRNKTIHLRHPPNVPARWLSDVHLAVLRELTLGPGTLAELGRRTGVDDPTLAHALAALFHGNAITTTPERAGPVIGIPDSREGRASHDADAPPQSSGGGDPTAPAPLGLR